MAALDSCVFCKSSLGEGGVVIVEKGLPTLLNCSIARGDLENKTVFEDLIKSNSSITVHTTCRRNYSRPSTIKKDISKTASLDDDDDLSTRRLRSSLDPFDIKHDCLFCGDEANLKKETKKEFKHRRIVHDVESFAFQRSILEQASRRSDKWGEIVKARVMTAVDLVAAEAKYHHPCHLLFFSSGSLVSEDSVPKRPGRTEDPLPAAAFRRVCEFMEKADDCQFSLRELLDVMASDQCNIAYTSKWLKENLQLHYGGNVTVTEMSGKNAVVNFRGTTEATIWDKWHSERKKTVIDERMRVVLAAAEIIRQDICSVVCSKDVYPNISDKYEPDLPQTVTALLQNIISSRGAQNEGAKRKQMAIGEALMSAPRPRSYISPVMLGLGVYVHRNYASRMLIDVLSSLSFSTAYSEVQRYEYSAMESSAVERPVVEGFCQYAFDNADFNVRTLTGLGTFHCMGGVRMTTPAVDESNKLPIHRIVKRPTAAAIAAAHGNTSVTWYHKPPSGLKKVTIREVRAVSTAEAKSVKVALASDLLWASGRWLRQTLPPSWNGFMRAAINVGEVSWQNTSVESVPFINLEPSNPSTIYTALLFAANECRRRHQGNCFVTFDQPLYAKATEIVASAPPGELDNVFIRLGGFHLLMSFLGSVGFIITGSGLEELWTEVYAKSSVVHMMSGHAYSRVVRAHMLTYEALSLMLFEMIEDPDTQIALVGECYKAVSSRKKPLLEVSESAVLAELMMAFERLCDKLALRSRTSKLWVRYMQQIDLIRLFIRAERAGEWELHLHCIRAMLPHFHAAGHLNYAKSAQLYVQQMEDLETKMPAEEYAQFVREGLFTVRRKPEPWAGVWTDMCIEQDLMRQFKAQGGLTHGRGISESTLACFVLAFPACMKVCEVLETLTGVKSGSTEQHVELRDSRRKRDSKDVATFKAWLADHNPWSYESDYLRSLSSGIVGDDSTNCDSAREVGEEGMKRMIGASFGDLKLSRKSRVRPIASVHSGIMVREEFIPVNPHQLFMRIVCVMKSEDDLRDYLAFELSPTPPALFDTVSLRKTAKSVIQTCFPSSSPLDYDVDGRYIVLDGGYLLHAVVWPRPATYGQIAQAYVTYIKKRYGLSVTVVFDGYEMNSTKSQEQRRRAAKRILTDVLFDVNTSVKIAQVDFLCNPKNKTRLIDLLSDQFQEAGIYVKRAPSDADALIVKEALAKDLSGQRTIVVTSDTDILVMLIARAKCDTLITMLNPGTNTSTGKVFNIQEIQKNSGSMADYILFWHAMTGCDTTSALYKMGKKKSVEIDQ